MKIITIIFLFTFYGLAKNIDNSFITKFEYGAMLYENPRGIGCNKCHNSGKSTVLISKFTDKDNQIQAIEAPPISKVSYLSFKKKLKASKSESLVMPTYFLTNEEIESIYFYITNLKAVQ